jgi:hypothetical protein
MTSIEAETGVVNNTISHTEEHLREAISLVGAAAADIELVKELDGLTEEQQQRLNLISRHIIFHAEGIQFLTKTESEDTEFVSRTDLRGNDFEPFMPQTPDSVGQNGDHHNVTSQGSGVFPSQDEQAQAASTDIRTSETPDVTDVYDSVSQFETQPGQIPGAEDFKGRTHTLLEVLFSHPGQKFTSLDLQAQIDGAVSSKPMTVSNFVNSLRNHNLGQYFHTGRSGKRHLYWVELPDAGTDDVVDTAAVSTDGTETQQTAPEITLTKWGLSVNPEEPDILLYNNQPVKMRLEAIDVIKTLIHHHDTMEFTDLYVEMQKIWPEISADRLQGALHEVSNFFDEYADKDDWYDKVLRTDGGPSRYLKIKGVVGGEDTDFLAQTMKSRHLARSS